MEINNESNRWKINFKKLVDKATKIGYTVKMSNIDQCHFNNKIVYINRNRTDQNKVYVLAHELGHIEIRAKYPPNNEFIRRFPGSISAKNSKAKKLATLEEEVLAWDEGKKILYNLDIEVNDIIFNRLKTICLGTYL